jgi:hypothetical protein
LQLFKSVQVIIDMEVFRHVYIYPNALSHTLKGLVLIEYVMKIR